MASNASYCLDGALENLRKHENSLLSAQIKKVLGKKSQHATWSAASKRDLLGQLSQLLLEKDFTLAICAQLKPLVLQLLYQVADLVNGDSIQHKKLCLALSKLVMLYPQTGEFAVNYLEVNTPFFYNNKGNQEPVKKKAKKTAEKTKDEIPVVELCEAAYLFLLSDTDRFTQVYDWSHLTTYLSIDNQKVKWYVVQSICLINQISGQSKQSLLDKYFSKSEQCQLVTQQLALERDLQSTCITSDNGCQILLYDTCKENSGTCVISIDDLHDSLTSVCGIILPKLTAEDKADQETSSVMKRVIPVPSTLSALQNVAMSVSSGEPVIVSGHIGAGKTCLIEYLSQLTGREDKLIKVQLGEQIDSKALLGTYCCTETPGQFVWRPGPLTTAVQNGQWLLLEDIDIAPMDVISSLLPLIEAGTLPSTNQGQSTKAKPGFQLFMTKRLQSAGGISAHSHCTLLEKSVTTVTIQPLTRTELSTVIKSLHPNLTRVVDRLLDMYFTLSAGKHTDDRDEDVADTEMIRLTKLYGSRKLSTRDLLRWCARISNNFQLISTDNEIAVFQEALDCFCDSLPKSSQRLKLAEAIGTKINVSAEKAQYYCKIHKPTIELSKEKMNIGRTSLERRQLTATDSLNRETNSRFAFTRQSSALLEKIAVCVNHEEPVLLVGETGTGKTSVVQYIAQQTGRTLRVINMNQQSDSSDLLGGYKPVMIGRIIQPLREEFEMLFCKTFSRKQNQTFLSHVQQCFSAKRWADLLKLIEHTVKAGLGKNLHQDKWRQIQEKLTTVKLQVKYAENALAFSFVEGALVKALKAGEWVLLDEINLATAETLDCLCGLLDSSSGSVTLVERGDKGPVVRHPEFRLFACMNPATDVGKKDLTAGVRSRFTEFYVDELEIKQDLRVLVSAYLSGLSLEPKQIDGIVNFYLAIKTEALLRLTDGTGRRPTYSLRTLCRALRYAASNPYQAVQRSLYEAFSMSFLTQLDRASHPSVTKLIIQHILGKAKAKPILSKLLLPPMGGECEKFEGYWLSRGDKKPIRDENYILTDTVKANMRDVARVVACGKHPVLLQGETSVGKTSMIEYIAKASGNRCVRINNHEHTDVQEYTGSYVADELGHLVFKEGILVDAMRNGYWIILDELNLAPTDVLEALNRLLDDNRELFIAETQQTVKAHPKFLLFATQNPPGLYGGRKMLSRAFRNRFVELHFDEIPNSELEFILHKRCALPLSSSKKIIRVMSELQLRRRDSGLFAGKQGYITLRDVFRWGERYRQSSAAITDTFYDWDQLLADQGFMLLAGRVRKQLEEQVIAEVLSKHFKRTVDPLRLFSKTSTYSKEALEQISGDDVEGQFSHIVWTYSLTRLAVLVGQCMKYNEPVLMVGDTGCGKTTICQYFAHIYERQLFTVNCHMHTEGSHFLGGLRPVRHGGEDQMDDSTDDQTSGRLFEWQDGPLVISMRSGGVLLVDEISLADDSVLERLNSVLEPSRTLVLAEKGGELETITAEPEFRIVATMNPAGDYGKKELSPALRNRFTEIWCPQTQDLNDYRLIIQHNIASGLTLKDNLEYGDAIVEFIEWFQNQEFGKRFTISVRDVMAWINFINKCCVSSMTSLPAKSHDYSALVYIHGACLVFLDALGSASIADSHSARERSLQFLSRQMNSSEDKVLNIDTQRDLKIGEESLTIEPFSIPMGAADRKLTHYSLQAPSTCVNCLRLLRGLQLHKPILLEGSPGVGKTSLVTALAKASGHHIVRINLSEQTDIADLFGADLPVDGGKGGQFSWRDGLFLQALKSGHWIVLDELNLASQSVLEGLNACFDHRAEVYVPELGKTFHIQHENVKIFACQNPLKQGGGRKGLPQSFLNRFTQVYVDEMSCEDQQFITQSMYSDIPDSLVRQMVLICRQMVEKRLPGEYNLRDIFRWCDLIIKYQLQENYSLSEHFSLLFIQPLMSSPALCEKAYDIFEEITGVKARQDTDTVRQFHITDSHLLVGNILLERQSHLPLSHTQSCILHKQLAPLEYLATCMHIGWMAILDGPECSGKSTLAHMLTQLIGEDLKVFSMNSAMDTTDLLGGFEQADLNRSLDKLCDEVAVRLRSKVGDLLLTSPCDALTLMQSVYKLGTQTNLMMKSSVLSSILDMAAQESLNIDSEVVSSWRDTLAVITEKITLQAMSSSAGSGSFEWTDSILVEAVSKGHWLLIENAHICSASVLDRLNSLLEPNGSLTITERGVIDGQSVTIKPHPNFRLILTTNSQQKEISRAMKNRGVVISTTNFTRQAEDAVFDDEKLFSLLGVSPALSSILKSEHTEMLNSSGVTHYVTSSAGQQIVYERAKLLTSYRQKGFSVEQALHVSRRLYMYYTDMREGQMDVTQLPTDISTYEGSPVDDVVWTTDKQCLMPSLSSLSILSTDIRTANHICGGVSESVLCPVLLERLSIDNMRLLDCELPFLTSVVSDKENLISIRDQSQDILHKIISVISDLSSSDMSGLPADLRWISDLWRKLSDCDSKHRLNYLLNVWNTLLIFRQLQTDIENLAANSWSALSRRVHQGTLDLKHLPHRVAMFYRQLSQCFSFLILTMTDSEISDSILSEILLTVEYIRRFLTSNSIISATLSWSWLEPAVQHIMSICSTEELSSVVSRIDGLLCENNTESFLYNLVWNSFPHVSPINCLLRGVAQVGGDKSQLSNLLQKVVDNLDVYGKANTKERSKLIACLSNTNMSDIIHTVTNCQSVLHSVDQGERIAECLVDLTRLLQLTPSSGSQPEQPEQLSALWPMYEYWYTRSLHKLLSSQYDDDEKRSMLEKLASYNQTPGMIQLAADVTMLVSDQQCVSLQMNMICSFLHSLIKSSAFRKGSPFISDTTTTITDNQVRPSFSSTSLFLITSSLLSDNLTDQDSTSEPEAEDGDMSCPINSFSPPVCLGKYKAKLCQLNTVKEEIWRHASLMDTNNTSDEESSLQRLYIDMVLRSEYIPTELKQHAMIKPAIQTMEQLTLHNQSDEDIAMVACRWIWLGYIQSVSAAPRGVLDPVVKGSTELQFVNDEISRMETELSLRRELIRVQTGVELSSHTHPYYCYIQSRLRDLQLRQRELTENSVHRPQQQQFLALVSEAKGLLSNTLHYDNLQSIITGLQTGGKVNKAIARELMMQATLDSYTHKIANTYPLYTDCFQPHINGIKLICYGLKRLAYITSSREHKEETAHVISALTDVMSSPAQLYSSVTSCEEGVKVLESICESANITDENKKTLDSQYLRLYLSSVTTDAYNSPTLTQDLLSKLTSLIDHYLEAWKADNVRRAEKEQEMTSLYSFKQHGEEIETDEQLIDKMTQQNFPSYHQEFSDLVQPDTLGDSTEEMTQEKPKEDNSHISLSDKDMEAISELHCNVMQCLAETEWFKNDERSSLQSDRMKSHTLLLNMLQQIISNMSYCNEGSSLSVSLAHMQLISAGMMRGQCQGQAISATDLRADARYDIYRDENVSQAVRSMDCLNVVRLRIRELLDEWPDHPLLLQIISILDRIESFRITDPLMKFTTGLELVLEKLQEWETNAARHVSVQEPMNTVSLLVIEWRKLELDGWKQSLESVAYKIEQSATKYWFHLCSVLLPAAAQSAQEKPSDISEITQPVIQFIESSTIGDFEYRLRILTTLTIHLSFLNGTKHNATVNCLHSIRRFYGQFKSTVKTHLTKNRSSIEKELKNFVKISRWNDMNYWSVRASVDKAHKTLAKHMKAYHDILSAPASKLFTEDISEIPSISETEDFVPPTESQKNEHNFKTLSKSVAIPTELLESDALECLPRICQLNEKFGNACRQITSLLRTHSQTNKALNNFSVQIIETVNELQALKIISGEDKEKQKKQARNIDMRKRKALSTLFQTLHKIGLSYRKGCMKLQTCGEDDRNDLLCTSEMLPLDLEVGLSQNHPSNVGWIEVWKSSVRYMLRSLTRRSVFQSESAKPSKELGPDIIQRLKGYSEHMISLLRHQECGLTQQTVYYLRMSELSSTLSSLHAEGVRRESPLSSSIHQVVTQISTSLPGLIEYLEEYKMLLHSAPSSSTSSSSSSSTDNSVSISKSPCVDNMLTPVSNITTYSNQWQSLVGSTNVCLSQLRSVSKFFSDLSSRSVKVYSNSELENITRHLESIQSAVTAVQQDCQQFKTKEGNVVLVHQISSALEDFTQTVTTCTSSLTCDPPTSRDQSFGREEFVTKTDSLVKDILLACQHTVGSLETVQQEGETTTDTEDDRDLSDIHLSDTLKLLDDVSNNLKLEKIQNELSQLLNDASCDTNSTSRHNKLQILAGCTEIVGDYRELSRCILEHSWNIFRNSGKLLSILYNIFTHLASKGFCLPEELSDEMDGEGEGNFNTSEGAGLADGQGTKDVSDQIEDEADLDDAKRQEDRDKEKEEEPDSAPPPPGEDKAIEMSQDFDGAMEDAPATEVDEEDDAASSGDEDEMDDKMGDIGDSDLREKLDDKMWGDDDKEDEDKEENKEKSEEETGKGSEESKQEMVAKDDNPEDTVDNKNKDKSEAAEADQEEKDVNELEEKQDEDADEYDKNEKPDPYFDGENDDEKPPETDENFDLPDDLDLDNAGDEGQEEAEPMDIGEDDDDDSEMAEEKQQPSNEEESGEQDNTEEEGDDPTIGQPEEEETNPDKTDPEQDQQTNTESYGATTETNDQQIIEQSAQDKGGEAESKEEQGAGQSESSDQKEAGQGESYQTAAASEDKQNQDQHTSGENQKSDENRVLGDTQEQVTKDLDTIKSSNNKQPPARQRHQDKPPPSNTLYEHITQDQTESADAQTMDAANEEQLTEQQKSDQLEPEADIRPEQDKQTDKRQIEEPEKLTPREMAEKMSSALSKDMKGATEQEKMEVEEEELQTQEDAEDDKTDITEGHGNTQSTIHTDIELLHLSQQEVSAIKQDLEVRLAEWSLKPDNYEISEGEARQAWEKYDTVTRNLSHELCEQLRLILEPTQAAKLRGDYRTGKRLNMRKVIAYIASQFRKDKIWLRRTEPSKREYQVALCVDDSSSMIDNHSKQLAFEALACISNALTYLQAGDLAIASFGEDVKMVHDFSSRFSYDDGASVLRNFTFNQKKTKVAHMLNTMTNKFLSLRRSGTTAKHELAQLLMIVSDGRGLFLEGVETVKQAVRRAMNAGVFLVFVIIDNPNSKDSILDIKMPVFTGTGPPQIKSYMDSFPFPFYVILRDINSLPHTLGDALRQWFELVTSQT